MEDYWMRKSPGIAWMLRWGPALLVMIVIFFLSSRTSQTLEEVGLTSTPFRKLGHMTEYAVLALALLRGIGRFNPRNILLVLFISVIYAASDEIHQSFVPGRSCLFTDVLIDGAGSTLGCLIISLWSLLRRLVFWYPQNAIPIQR